ncbi:uncharacterized protein LOC120253121 [Dioscorea cayenensis subsp. rotundata]|uniref:RING-type E3 ubiquitin transferase n=1 Tax=Dioscorea cayennensis subsp. rotundata TaxID=55577 RepID=A0AB40ARS0_DIOCR|nr:uncharacterized protein LOC120253121 [Dioscorea cayenensis subsp. rotundata]XP_039117345.1 uncharacterized protein LOC120253121 [Dioscorea cayenensis subsp. rotundata]
MMAVIPHLWVACLFMALAITRTLSYHRVVPARLPDAFSQETLVPHEYSRYSEVKDACKLILKSASKDKINANRASSIIPELNFIMGDWRQDHGTAPLMPFDASDAPQSSSVLPDPAHLVTFALTHVDLATTSNNAFNVSGELSIGLFRNGTGLEVNHFFNPEFRFWPGNSELRVSFEGIYVESEKNGGERVLCMLGNALLPSRQPDSADPWEWVNDARMNKYQPPLLEDDKVLLVLHYPKNFTLTTRAARGELRSLNQVSSIRYFDKISLVSQLGAYSYYQYGSEELVSKACSPYPYPNDSVRGWFELYKGVGLCEVLDRFINGQLLNVVPNWNCNSTDEYCRKLGPFATEREINATDGGFDNVKLAMQDVRCESRMESYNKTSAKVSAVFRVISPWENQYTAVQRSGLDNTTLSVEGIWNSSSGQLCMVGCLGLTDRNCHSRICLYIPTSFSINQRNIIFGRISSIDDHGNNSFFPLSFERPVHPSEIWDKLSNTYLSYKYSKIKLAGSFLERSEPFEFGAIIKKSFLSYPRKSEKNDELVGLSSLADDLTLHSSAVQDPLPKVRTDRPFLQMEILSLDKLFGRYWTYQYQNSSSTKEKNPASTKDVSTERKLLLNVSAELTLSGKLYSNVSVLYLEGLYNPVSGKMYLIGCRDVRASWKILFESRDLEDGLDCLIEVIIEYPPTTARWLMNPTAKVSIISQRTEDDPLHFSQIKLQTLPILYHEQRQDILSRKGVEGSLRILTLSIAVACIVFQLVYIRDNTASVPYISLVMLGVQALGYSIPLITGAEALFAQLKSETYDYPSYGFEKNQWFQISDYLVKILVLGAFLLTLRLGQKVWKSRIRLLSRTPLEPGRVPNDKWVLIISCGLHLAGFLVILILQGVNAPPRQIRPDQYFLDSRGNRRKMHDWEIQLEEYVGLIQDFFLLPQIIGNTMWQLNGKPLRKVYYFGITLVRILPHVYDYVRAPVFNPYFSEEYEFVNPALDFYSKFDDVAIPMTAILLSILVYVQQRWDCHKFFQSLRSGEKIFLPLGSRVYERLPSVSFEAELTPGVNESATQDAKHMDEE